MPSSAIFPPSTTKIRSQSCTVDRRWDLVKQTKDESRFFLDIKLGHDVGLVKGEKIVLETLAKLPEKCPEIIGKPKYIGVTELPVRNALTGQIDGITLRVSHRPPTVQTPAYS